MKRILLILVCFLQFNYLFGALPEEEEELIILFAFNDHYLIYKTPSENIKDYGWSKELAGKTGTKIYYDTQTNFVSFSKYGIKERHKERIITRSLYWIANLKKDDETRKILFDNLTNNPYDLYFKLNVIIAIFDFLSADEIYDFIRDILTGKYGEVISFEVLGICEDTYNSNPDKREAIISALYDFLKERIPEKDFLGNEKQVRYYIEKMKGDVLPERKAILEEAVAYYKDKPEFENELKEVKNRIREIEKQEVKIWFGKWWWSIAFAVVFITGGIVLVVRIRSL